MSRFQLTSSAKYLVQEALLFLLFSCLLILSGTTSGLVDLQQFTLFAAAVTAAASVWFVFGLKSQNPLLKPFLLWCGVYLASALLSNDPRRSFSQSLLMMTGIFIFSLVSDLVSRGWQPELFTKIILILGGVICALGYVEVGIWYGNWITSFPGEWFPALLYRPASANVIAGFLNIILLLALTRLLSTQNKIPRFLLLCEIAAAVPLIYLASSRGGWLGLAFGLMAVGYFYFNQMKPLLQNLWEKSKRIGILKWLAVVLIVGIVIFGSWLLYRQATHPTHNNLFVSRKEFWGPALNAFLSSPLTGTGPFTYANAYLRENSVPPQFLFIHSHGTAFNILAEMGLFGAAALLWLVYSAASQLLRVSKNVTGHNQAVISGTLAGMVALGVHSIFDCFHAEPITLWTWIIALGASLGQSSEPLPKKRPYPVLLLVICLWVEIWLTAPLHQAVNLVDHGQLNEALPAVNLAVKRDPTSVIASQQQALLLARIGAAGNKEYLMNAIRSFDTTIRMEPLWAANRLNKGALFSALGDDRHAKIEFEWLVKLTPGCAVCYLNYALASEKSNDPYSAQNAYAKFLDLTPDPFPAYFWRSSPLRTQVFQEWSAAHPQTPPNFSELERTVAGNPQVLIFYNRFAAALIEQDRLKEAEFVLKRADFAYSEVFSDVLEKDWLKAELLFLQGESTQAIALADKTILQYQLQGMWGPGSFGRLYYAPLMFRRPAFSAEIVPQAQSFPLTDRWAKRILSLAQWHLSSGSQEQAARLQSIIQAAAPDMLSR